MGMENELINKGIVKVAFSPFFFTFWGILTNVGCRFRKYLCLMEILSCHSAPCYHVIGFRRKLVEKIPTSLHLNARRPGFLCVTVKSKRGVFSYSHQDCFCINDFYRASRSLNTHKVCQNFNLRVLCQRYDSYVIDEEQHGTNVTEIGEAVPKLLIPSLPDESEGDCSAPISSCFWEWKPKLKVHYEKAGCQNVSSPPVLFLPGFGVGSFHYEKQLKDLGRDSRAWAVDFLGQGMSLPYEDPTPQWDDHIFNRENFVWGFGDEPKPWADKLVYSIDLWRDQVRYFIEEVIGEPVYVVGNSLGGFVALYFAACNPELVKGVSLLNATPFWGFLPNPVRYPKLSRIIPWAGTFPLPASVKKLTEIVWQKISDPRTIAEVLKQVYADHTTNVDKVFSRILEITQHPAAAASFASIMFAPQGQLSFREALSRCQMNNVPVCLMYGKEDPWVKPVWALQVKRQLPKAPYYEITPAGHCPHDEVPEVINYLLRGWIKSLESQGSVAMPLLDNPENAPYDIARNIEFFQEGSRKSVRVQYYGSNFSLWNQIISYIKSRFGDSSTNS